MAQTMKYDKDGKGYYTPRQVMQMAQERGLPARLVNGRSVMPLSTVEALGVTRDWSRYYVIDEAKASGGSPTPDPFDFRHPVSKEDMEKYEREDQRRAAKRRAGLQQFLQKYAACGGQS